MKHWLSAVACHTADCQIPSSDSLQINLYFAPGVVFLGKYGTGAEWRRTWVVQSDGGRSKKKVKRVQAVGRTDLWASERKREFTDEQNVSQRVKAGSVLQSKQEFITSWVSCLCFVYHTHSCDQAHYYYYLWFIFTSIPSSYKYRAIELFFLTRIPGDRGWRWSSFNSFLPCELAL